MEEVKEKKQTAEFILSDGRKCTIIKGKGKDVSEAMKFAGADSGRYLFALIARVTTIDEKPIVAEDLDELPMDDVMKIQTEFTEINF